MTDSKHEQINDAITAYHAETIRTDVDNQILNDVVKQVGGKRIYTSNYQRCGGHENSVSISASMPKYFKGKHIKPLAPSWDILNAFKAGQIDELEYTKQYLALLTTRNLTPESVYENIPNGTIMLCYEKPGDFCHRRILATWLENHLGVEIPEWETEEEREKLAVVDSLLEF